MHIHFVQHVSFESPAYLLDWALAQGHHTSFTRLYEPEAFPALHHFDWLVIMGGPMSVQDDEQYPWLVQEKAFIRNSIDAGKKVLGICLGAQLIAQVLGARVCKNQQKEIGWWPVQTIDAHHPLTKDFPASFNVFHWHGDTFELPLGATHLFQSEACRNQGFIIDDKVAGLQFHLEVSEPLVAQMMQHGKAELVTAPYIQEETSIFLNTLSMVPETQYLLDRFLSAFEKC